MRILSIAVLASLVLLAHAPLGAADEGDGYFSCERHVTDVIQGAIDDTTEFAEQVERDSIAFAQKLKCSLLETAMVCSSEETVPPGFPQTTGYASAHRDRCYEYGLASQPCGVGQKREHYYWYEPTSLERRESTRCVALYCGFVTDPLTTTNVGGRYLVSPCPQRAW